VSAGVLLAVVPLSAWAQQGHSAPNRPVHHLPLLSPTGSPIASKQAVIVFGIKGGNIRPWNASFFSDGSVIGNGINVRTGQLMQPRPVLKGLLKLVNAEHFYSMRNRTLCPRVLPDIASRYITIYRSSATKTVTIHGSCSSNFNQLYAVIEEMAGIGR